MRLDIERVAALVREAAACHVLPRFRALASDEVGAKAHERDLVTVADLETEAWLGARLAELVPGSVVVGEEAVFKNPELVPGLAHAAAAWLIDPVDGTWNFVHGKPDFAVIVAYLRGGETVAGWIHEPANGRMAMGEEGAGVTLDGAPVTAIGTGGARYSGNTVRHHYDRASALPDLFATVRRTSCAGHDYILLFDAVSDFSAYTRILPWDHAAGSFLVRAAGGRSARFDGTPYDPARPVGELLSARDAAAWHTIRDALTAPA